MSREERFGRILRVVAVVHIAVLAAVVLFPGLRSLFEPKKETTLPVEFVVEAPQDPVPALPPVVPPPSIPPPSKPRRVIERSTTRVDKQPTRPEREPMTEEEIRKLLAQGAKLSDHTSVPDEDTRCFELVRRALYGAWDQPAAAEAGNARAEVALRLGAGGRVVSRDIVKSSGNSVLDASVKVALNAVERITGLTAGFMERHKVVTISFRVE